MELFTHLLIELQSNCNRNCYFCQRYVDTSGKRKTEDGKHVIESMPTEHIIRILDEAESMGFKGYVKFEHLSEPFLDKRIIDMASEAKKRGMLTRLNTNGDLLRKDAPLSKEAARVFDLIVVGIYDLKDRPLINKEKVFWKRRLIGTTVKFSVATSRIPRTHIPWDERMSRKKETYINNRCKMPSSRFIIHYDGNVAFCCEDMLEEFDLGNAFGTNIKDIWFSDKHTQMISDLKKGLRGKYSLCSKCCIP